MGYKHFYLNVIARLALIIIALSVVIYQFFIRNDYIITFFGLLFTVLLITSLFSYINKTNRDFTNFLTSFVNNDFTIHYSGRDKGHSFDKLYKTFELIQAQFRTLSFEKELINQHLQHLVEHIDVGIISLDEKHKIQLINKAFKNMFGVPNLNRGQNITKLGKTFTGIIAEINPGDKKLTKLRINNSNQQLAIYANDYRLNNIAYKLISFKNIHGELDEREMESYQKLIRVLTHEIMNTLSPIISLSGTINQSVDELVNEQIPIDADTSSYLKEGIAAIQDRSEGLLNFTKAYRKLMRLPTPKPIQVEVEGYFKKLQLLFEQELQKKQIEFSIANPQALTHLFIDPELFEQVLINIYKNAIESFEPPQFETGSEFIPIIKTLISKESHISSIKISDNGCGMDDEAQDKAFIPFYTTKEEGSGIGLSLSKQIVLLHKGSLIFDSGKGKGTEISIFLKA